MALHEVQLKGYSVRPGNLSLGTFDSYGIEQLHITLDDTWSGLAVTATFNPPEGEPVEIRVPENGLIDVPAEATANEGTGTIVYCGVANGAQRISKTQGYSVITHGNVGTTVPFNPSESLATQVLQAALSAEQSSAEAKSVADGLRSDAANGKFDGKDGAKGDKGDTGTTPQLKIGEDNLWHVSYDNGATWVSLGVKATGDTGAAGKDGVDGLTPYIGRYSHWWIGNTDTGILAKGVKGDTGAKGADGVSPTASVTQTDDGAKFTVTDGRGTTTAVVKNGVDGKNGAPGANGVSPTVQVETIDGGHRVTLTDASGAHAVDVLDGKPGKDAVVDATLTQDGQAADAKVTGEKISQLQKRQNVLVGSETGNPVSCDDAFAAPLCGLNVYGKSTQDGTPSPDNPVPIVSAGDGGTIAVKMTGKNLLYILDGKETARGVTITSKNGIISISGTATENGYVYLPVKQISIHGLAFLSSNVSATTVKLVSASWNVLFTQGRANNTQEVITRICFVLKKGTNYDLNGIYVQLELGSTATTYSPYREQLLTLSTPNGLPGIPVTSGGNYTDPSGQQWICDEVDLERGLKVQRVGKAELTNVSASHEIISMNRWDSYHLDKVQPFRIKTIKAIQKTPVICRTLPSTKNNTEAWQLDYECIGMVYDNSVAIIDFYISNERLGTTAETTEDEAVNALVNWLKTNPLSFIYAIATPIETPLAPTEIATYKALTTYAPDTVVQASDGAGIKLDYQRDVNLVVKNLEDAIASMTTT